MGLRVQPKPRLALAGPGNYRRGTVPPGPSKDQNRMFQPLRRAGLVSLLLAVTSLPLSAEPAPEVTALARQVLNDLQAESIRRNREYCGLIGRAPDGRLVVGKPRRGWRASCRPRLLPADVTEIASYHTHGAYSDRYDNEVPSTDDLLADHDGGTDGYVATPGGRFWVIDGSALTTRQICGLGCLASDPAFEPDPELPVAPRYTLEQLEQRGF